MQISVEEQDFQGARRVDKQCCPVARAMTRHGFKGVYVDGGLISYREGDRRRMFRCPPSVKVFIAEWDGYGGGQPFSFDAPLPPGTP